MADLKLRWKTNRYADRIATRNTTSSNKDKANDILRDAGCVGDHGATVRVADRDDWSGNLLDDAGYVRRVVSDTA